MLIKQQKFDNQPKTFFDNYLETIYNHTEASYEQVSMVALAIFGTILSYAGLENCNLYVIDLSATGTGKTHNVSLQSEVLFDEIIKKQQLKQKPDKSEERHNIIHKSKITAPAIYSSLKFCSTQFIQIDELGLALKNKSDKELIQYITQLYGSKIAIAPTLKHEFSDKFKLASKVTFVGLTNMKYLGKDFDLHLEGGFLNRALLIFNNKIRISQDLPAKYELSIEDKQKYINLTKIIYNFYSNIPPHVLQIDDEQLKIFRYKINDLKKDNTENGMFGSLYNRVYQNFLYVLHILHYLHCFETKLFETIVKAELIESTIQFFETTILGELDKLLIEVSKVTKEDREFAITDKLLDKLRKYNGKMTLRELQQANVVKGLTSAEIKKYLKAYCSFQKINRSTIIKII